MLGPVARCATRKVLVGGFALIDAAEGTPEWLGARHPKYAIRKSSLWTFRNLTKRIKTKDIYIEIKYDQVH